MARSPLTLTKAKERFKKRQRRFVVGYLQSGNGIRTNGFKSIGYGTGYRGHTYSDPMTWKEASALLATMPCSRCAILELAPVALNGGE